MGAVRTRRTLDIKGADAVMAAAESEATRNGYRVVIAIVDAWGHLLQLRRTEDAQAASVQVAVDKARTAAIFVRPSRVIEQQVSSGRLGALALHGAAALTGGIPLRAGDEVIGAIGTSGETPDQDELVSLAGARAAFGVTEVPALTYSGARAAALYRRPSKDFEDQAAHGRPSALHLAQAVPLQGGVPVVHRGQVIAAVGVSGASSADEDNELAVLAAGAAAAAAAPRG